MDGMIDPSGIVDTKDLLLIHIWGHQYNAGTPAHRPPHLDVEAGLSYGGIVVVIGRGSVAIRWVIGRVQRGGDQIQHRRILDTQGGIGEFEVIRGVSLKWDTVSLSVCTYCVTSTLFPHVGEHGEARVEVVNTSDGGQSALARAFVSAGIKVWISVD